MIFDKYPYTNFHEMNDDWIIQTLQEFGKRLDDFVAANSLTYADPIGYNPATTYPAYTVVIYNDTAYMSKVTAPAGVQPTNDEYYLQIFPFGDLIAQMVDEGVDAGVTVLTERVDQYLASAGEEIDAAIANIPLEVAEWMDNHPEITTTIPNDSVSYPKLTGQLRAVLLFGRQAGSPTDIPNTDFSQGSINPSTGVNMAANNVCRTDFYSFDDGILTVRALSGYSVKVYSYLSNGTYMGIVSPAIGSDYDAFTVNTSSKYRFSIMKSDQSDFTPNDLPENPIRYREFLPNREYVNDLDQHQTNFIVPESSEYISATLADFDADYRTYNGVAVNSAGQVLESANFNSFAFKCPHDDFKFKTSIFRIFITNQYPQVGAKIPLKDTLAYDSFDMAAIRTIPHKGDIVVLCTPASYIPYFTSPYANAAVIRNLFLADQYDTFKRNAVIDTGVSIAGNDLLNVQKATGKLIAATTGGLTSNASYNTYYFRVTIPVLTVKCTNGFRACLSLTDPSLTAQASNLKQLLYNTSSERVETFAAHLNDWVAISIPAAQNIDLQTDYANRFTLPELRLDWKQVNSFYKYVTETNARRLYVYYKSGHKYVRWELHNIPAAASNSNTWQLGAVYGYDETLTTGVELVSAGEFELAFKEWGSADYCGGNNHGDENTDDFTLMIDGEMITLENLDNEYHVFNRIDAIEHATINRCDTPDEDILTHQKVWSFENGTVKVRQSLEFLEALKCDFLCGMLAANRSALKYGVRQGRVGTEDMSTSSFPRIVTYGNETMYLMYGPNADAKVSVTCESHTPAASLWVNNASTLNKLYCNFYGGIPTTQVEQGTVLQWRSEYDIAYH